MGGQCLIPICALKIFLHLFLHHWKILCGPGCWTRCCHGLSCPTVCKSVHLISNRSSLPSACCLSPPRLQFAPLQYLSVPFRARRSPSAAYVNAPAWDVDSPGTLGGSSRLLTVHTVNPQSTSRALFYFTTLLIEFCRRYCLSYSWDQHRLSWQLLSDGCNLCAWRRVRKLMARRSSSSKKHKILVTNSAQ